MFLQRSLQKGRCALAGLYTLSPLHVGHVTILGFAWVMEFQDYRANQEHSVSSNAASSALG